MRESRSPGSVRGAPSNGCPYRERSSVSLVEGRAKARHEKHRTSTTKQLVSGSSFPIKRAVIEFWRVFFRSKLSRKALTYSVVRFVQSPQRVD